MDEWDKLIQDQMGSDDSDSQNSIKEFLSQPDEFDNLINYVMSNPDIPINVEPPKIPETEIPKIQSQPAIPFQMPGYLGQPLQPGKYDPLMDLTKIEFTVKDAKESISRIPAFLANTIEKRTGALIGKLGTSLTERKIEEAPASLKIMFPALFTESGKAAWKKYPGKIAEIVSNASKSFSEYMDTAAETGWEKTPEKLLKPDAFQKYPFSKAMQVAFSGIGQMSVPVVATLITKNPVILSSIGSAVIAGISKGQTYEDMRKSGKSIEDSDFYSSLDAAWNLVSEKIAFDKILGDKGKNIITKIIKGGVTEGTQELVQNVGSNLIAKVGWDKARGIMDGWLESVIGGAAGGGLFGAASGIQNNFPSKKELMTDSGLSSFIESNLEIAKKIAKAPLISRKIFKDITGNKESWNESERNNFALEVKKKINEMEVISNEKETDEAIRRQEDQEVIDAQIEQPDQIPEPAVSQYSIEPPKRTIEFTKEEWDNISPGDYESLSEKEREAQEYYFDLKEKQDEFDREAKESISQLSAEGATSPEQTIESLNKIGYDVNDLIDNYSEIIIGKKPPKPRKPRKQGNLITSENYQKRAQVYKEDIKKWETDLSDLKSELLSQDIGNLESFISNHIESNKNSKDPKAIELLSELEDLNSKIKNSSDILYNEKNFQEVLNGQRARELETKNELGKGTAGDEPGKPGKTSSDIGEQKTPDTERYEKSASEKVKEYSKSIENPSEEDNIFFEKGIEYKVKDKKTILNFDRVKTSDDAINAINEAANQEFDEIREFVGEKISNDEIIARAQEIGAMPKGFNRDKQLEFFAEVFNARKQLIKIAETGKVTKDLIESLKKVKSLSSFAGRLLQSHKIEADSITPQAMQMNEILNEISDMGVDLDELLKASEGVDFNNQKEVTIFYRKFVKPKMSDILDEYRYSNMLSSIGTHIKNFNSNLIQGLILNPATNLLSGKNVPAYFKGMYKALPEAINEAKRAFSGERILERPDLKRLRTNSPLVKWMYPITDALEASDVFFRTMIENAEIAQAVGNRSDVSNKELKQIRRIAEEKAKKVIFRESLDPENKAGQGYLLSAIDKLTTSVLKARDVKLVGWFVPFIQTPMSIFKQGIEYSPFGVTTIPGSINKREQLAKTMIGSIVFASAGMYALSGLTTWAAPTGEKDKEEFYGSGRLPYSIKLNDKWVSFSQIGPLALPFALAASLKWHFDENPKRISQTGYERLFKSLAGMMQFWSEQSFLTGIGDLQKAVRGDTSALKSSVTNFVRQVVPLTGLQNWVTTIIDPVFRRPDGEFSVKTLTQNIMKGIPFLSEYVPAIKDKTGAEQLRDYPILNAFAAYKFSKADEEGEIKYQEFLLKKEEKEKKNFKNQNMKDYLAGDEFDKESAKEFLSKWRGFKYKKGEPISEQRKRIKKSIKEEYGLSYDEINSRILKIIKIAEE